MGTTLTGTTPQDTYDSLIKVTDNGPLSGTLKALSDGLGNDSTLSLSTTAASIAGTLAVAGAATFDTSTLVVDAANDRVGIGTATPNYLLSSAGDAGLQGNENYLYFHSNYSIGNNARARIRAVGAGGGSGYGGDLRIDTRAQNNTWNADVVTVANTGSVGIGTSSPSTKLHTYLADGANDNTVRIQNGSNGYASSILLQGNNDGGSIYNFISSSTNLGTEHWRISGGAAISNFVISTASAERLRITSAGVVELAQGQIKFPATQVASADANTLDDYEEGTFTIGLTFDGSSTGMTTFYNTGTYTKVGRQVTVNGFFGLTNKGSSTGGALITGLPFTVANSNAHYSPASLRFYGITYTGTLQAFAIKNTTTIQIDDVTESGVVASITNSDFANDSDIMISLTYFV